MYSYPVADVAAAIKRRGGYEEVARRAGCSVSAVSKIANGARKKRTSADLLARLSAVLVADGLLSSESVETIASPTVGPPDAAQ